MVVNLAATLTGGRASIPMAAFGGIKGGTEGEGWLPEGNLVGLQNVSANYRFIMSIRCVSK